MQNSHLNYPPLAGQSTPLRAGLGLWAAAALCGVALCSATGAQVNNGVPRGTENTGVEQQLGAQLPLNLEFTNEEGVRVALGDSFRADRPVLLTFNYSDCPQLCQLQLNGVVDVLNEAGFTLGEDIQIVTIGIDPAESAARAKLTEGVYFDRYTGEGDVAGWDFLTAGLADEEAGEAVIRTAAAAAGYGYDLVNGEYSHEAALILCTPEGVVSRYLFGIQYEPNTFRYSMIEASKGALGNIIDRIRLTCFSFDPDAGSYVMQARSAMKLGGLLIVVIFGGFLVLFWRQEILSSMTGRPRKLSQAPMPVAASDAAAAHTPTPEPESTAVDSTPESTRVDRGV